MLLLRLGTTPRHVFSSFIIVISDTSRKEECVRLRLVGSSWKEQLSSSYTVIGSSCHFCQPRIQTYLINYDQMDVLGRLLTLLRVRSRSDIKNEKKLTPTSTTLCDPLHEVLKEEYFGKYPCPGCKERIRVYRQCFSELSSRQHYGKDVLRFEHRSKTTRERKVVRISIDYKAELAEAKRCSTSFLWGDFDRDEEVDEEGRIYTLLGENFLGLVSCMNCNKGLRFYSQMRSFNEGQDVRWVPVVKKVARGNRDIKSFCEKTGEQGLISKSSKP